MDDKTPNPAHILQVGLGFFASKTLLSAIELGLFTHLAKDKLTAVELGRKLGLHERSREDFLDTLVALGFLERDGQGAAARYANTPATGTFLDQNARSYMGGILEMANHRLYPLWGGLTDSLRTGVQRNTDDFEKLYADPAQLEEFASAMAGVQMGNIIALGEKFDFSRYRTLCDLGGASAALAVTIARRHPHMTCTTFDLAPMAPIAQRRIDAAGLSDRVTVSSGNFFQDPLPHADVITMGNILHDWGMEEKRTLIRRAFDALPPGGSFIAIENVIDDDRRQNVFGLLMSLNMLIETAGGFDYTAAQFKDWCQKAGFKSTQIIPLGGPASAAVAVK